MRPARTSETICSVSTKATSLWISLQCMPFCRASLSCETVIQSIWYRVLYIPLDGLIYVLHCFTKTTNQTPQKEIETAAKGLQLVRQEIAKRKKEAKHEK